MKKHTTLKPKYLLWAVYMMILSLFGACQKADKLDKDGLQCPVVAKEGPDDSVIGKWKLVKVELLFSPKPRTTDYSCSDIEYEFQEGGVLIVTGASEDTRSYKNGQYPFEFKNTPLNEHTTEKYTLKIGNGSISCGIQNNKMIFFNSYVDGEDYYFVRVE